MGIIIGALLVVFLIVSSSLLNGFVLMNLWEWFVQTAFDIPGLDMLHAMGIGLIINFLTYQEDAKTEDEDSIENVWVSSILKAYLRPMIVLLIGWILTLFM